jgi:hypothetical protein
MKRLSVILVSFAESGAPIRLNNGIKIHGPPLGSRRAADGVFYRALTSVSPARRAVTIRDARAQPV